MDIIKKDEYDKYKILEKEIDLIQSCINRMAQNSFIIKGWLITLVAIVLALLPESFDLKGLCIIIFTITLCFWYLDAYFLKMERLYRWKYEWVIINRLISNLYFYDLNPMNQNMWIDSENKKEPSIISVMYSKTMRPLYIPIIVIDIIFFLNCYLKWFLW